MLIRREKLVELIKLIRLKELKEKKNKFIITNKIKIEKTKIVETKIAELIKAIKEKSQGKMTRHIIKLLDI